MATETYRTPLQRVIREEGRKQSWLAQRVGCDEAHLSRIVNGLHPDDATKQSIADALGRDVTELWPAVAA